DAEEDEEPAAHELEPQAVDQQDEDRGAPERDLARRPDLLPERQRAVGSVEARGRQQESPDRQDEEEEEQKLIEREERQREDRRQDRSERALAEHPGEGQRQRRQGKVRQEYSQGDGARFLLQHRGVN